MIIILEGVDGVGKSSVSRILADQLPLSTLLKLSGAPRDSDEGEEWMKGVYSSLVPFLTLLGNKANIVMDRSWMSELVYSPLFKDYAADYLYGFADTMHNVADIRYVYLYASNQTLMRRMKDKASAQPNEKHPDAKTIEKVQTRYEILFTEFNSRYPGKCYSINTEFLTAKEVSSCILARLSISPKLETSYTAAL